MASRYGSKSQKGEHHVMQFDSATPLPNPRHERFATGLASGHHATHVYKECFSPKTENSAAASASALLRNPKVAARIEYLTSQITGNALSAAAVTAERTLTECARIGFANMGDFMTIGEDGLPRLNWRNLSRDQRAALAEVKVETIKRHSRKGESVTRVKFKLHSKMPALEFMGKYLGLFSEQPDAKKDPQAEARRAIGVKVLFALLDRKARGTLDAGMEALLNEFTGFVPPQSG